MTDPTSLTKADTMALVLSRQLRDGDSVVTGASAAIPATGFRMAKYLGREGLVTINGPTGTIDPSSDEVPASSGDARMLQGRFSIDSTEVLRYQMNGLIDVAFVGALQVDASARMNLVCVGDYDRPALRGPGTLGLTLAAVMPRIIIYLTRHDTRTFVEDVDFVSGAPLRRRSGGLQVIVTPIAVLGPNPSRDGLTLISHHGGASVQDVEARTGFTLNTEQAVETPPPSSAELEALRAVDTAGLLGTLELD